MSFSHEDVQRLIQLLDSSHFDELHLEAEGIKLSLRRGGATSTSALVTSLSAPIRIGFATCRTASGASRTDCSRPGAPTAPVGADATLLDVRAPMLGTFYGGSQAWRPHPSSRSAVTSTRTAPLGSSEVMKLMNSISAGVDGVVVEVLARDGDLVEFDQVLMRVRPA